MEVVKRRRNNSEKHTEQKIKFSIKDFFSKGDQILRKLRIWSHLLKKSLMENFIFCAVSTPTTRSAQPKLFLIFFNKWCLFDRDSIVAKMFNLDRISIAWFFYFYSKYLLLCLKLFKYKPRHDLHSKMSCYSDFKI